MKKNSNPGHKLEQQMFEIKNEIELLTDTGGGTWTVMSSASTGESNQSLSSDDWLSE